MSNYQGEPSYVDGAGDVADDPNTRSPMRLLNAIKNAERKFDKWQRKADRIDTLYANLGSWAEYAISESIYDSEFNLFWASMEVVKPSIYSRPPIPVVTPVFKDRKPEVRTASELLERCAIRGFSISDIDAVMLQVRDDLAIVARGVIWLTYESGEDAKPYGERVCIEHLDRKDFLHEPARKWADVGWVARRAWLTAKEARKRFGQKAENASYGQHKDDRGDEVDATPKAGFWEVWSKIDRKVYWVSEGCEDILDTSEPHLKLKNFFPCPRPAYGTMERRSLVPVPDIIYIEDQLSTINELTTRIHDLCQNLVVRGIIPAGSDVGDAIQMALADQDASRMFVPVPAAAFNSGSKFVEWLPIDMYANAILAAVQARRELIGNVQEILGIADIMRGETEAQETLGAQKLKAQYGSVRIRDKVSELVRIARDTVQIMSEIQAEEFDFDTLLEMARMELPKKSENTKKLNEIKTAVKKQLEEIAAGIEGNPEAAQNPQAAQQQFQQASQQVIAQYQPIIDQFEKAVTYEDVKKLLSEQKTGFADFDIQTDSTIYPDEQAEKQSRAEMLGAISNAAPVLQALGATGKEGIALGGGLIKATLAPFRLGRELDGLVDEWVESVANMPPPQGNEEQEGLVEAQKILAQAEQSKAQAAMANVEAKAAKDQAENQRKMMELQQKAQDSERKFGLEMQTAQLKLAEAEAKVRKTEADIEHVNAQIAAIFAKMGVDAKTVDLNEFKTITDVEFRAQDQQRQDVQTATQVEGQSFEQQQRLRGEDRSDRQQSLTEQQAERETGE